MKKRLGQLLLISFMFGFIITCGNTDARDQVRSEFGEPDEVIQQGRDQFWRETWCYFGESGGIGFQFRRTSGCGSLQNVYESLRYPLPSDSACVTFLKPADRDAPFPAQ